MDKTSYSLNFRWLAVIKNNLFCVALGDLHATEWPQQEWYYSKEKAPSPKLAKIHISYSLICKTLLVT